MVVEMLVMGADRGTNKTTMTTGHLVSTLGGGNIGTGVLIHSGIASSVAIMKLPHSLEVR